MQDFSSLHAYGSIAIGAIAGLLLVRGARAHKRSTAEFAEVFRWSRVQRTGGGLAFAVLAVGIVALPYAFEATRLNNEFDVAVAFAITAALFWGIADALNRRVLMSDSHVGAVTWAGSVKKISWDQVKLVTFHDYYGGFFRLHGAAQTIFLPVQIDGYLRAIAILEARVTRSSLETAKDGIALSRAVVQR